MCRLEWRLFGSGHLATNLGIRVIVPDRPGVGRSDFQKGRRLIDWPRDVSALADALELSRFAVLGFSGGGPYAVACAHSIPERLLAVGLASSPGPFTKPELTEGVNPTNLKLHAMNRQKPWLARLLYRLMAFGVRRQPQKVIEQILNSDIAVSDREAFSEDESQECFLAALRETFRRGVHGVQRDAAIMASDWGFDPREVTFPISLWHGEKDVWASPAMGRYLARSIPTVNATFCPKEGHFSLGVKFMTEILTRLSVSASKLL